MTAPVIPAAIDGLWGSTLSFAGRRYFSKAPRLLPTPNQAAPRGEFSSALYRRHREYNALIGAAAMYAALILKFVLLKN